MEREPDTDKCPPIDPVLEHARPHEAEAIEAHRRFGNWEAAAISLGIPAASARRRASDARRRAAARACAPEAGLNRQLGEGFALKGYSTLANNANGELTWFKVDREKQQQMEAWREAIEGFAAPLRGGFNDNSKPHYTNEDLCVVYPMGDPHIGMLSWHGETGTSHDLEIAERNLVSATRRLVASSAPADRAIIINVGDYFHSDNQSNRTERSGHQLDVDGRYAKVLEVGLRAMRACIEAALQRHKVVDVINARGNHDPYSSVALSIMLRNWYELSDRVRIADPAKYFHYLRFGRCLFGVTHGDGPKPQDLPGIMACDEPKLWGETTFRRWYTGHIHHETAKEFRGCVVESFNTLAARDAWHHQSGYRSERFATSHVWHRHHGLVDRHHIGIEQIEAAAA